MSEERALRPSIWGVQRRPADDHAEGADDVDASPTARRVLDLQRQAGNAAVTGAVQRSIWGDMSDWFEDAASAGGIKGGGSEAGGIKGVGSEAGGIKGVGSEAGGIKGVGSEAGAIKGVGSETGGMKAGGIDPTILADGGGSAAKGYEDGSEGAKGYDGYDAGGAKGGASPEEEAFKDSVDGPMIN